MNYTRIALAIAVSLASSTLAHADDYNSVCGGTTPPSGQKASYCTASKQAQSAGSKEGLMMMVYSAVAGTCAASCMGWIASDYICQGAALAASATDAIVTKNFTSALMGGASAAFGVFEDKTNGAAADTTKGKFACWMTAATSAMNAVTHGMSKSRDADLAQSNLDSAKNVNDSNGNGYNLNNGSLTGGTPGGSTGLATTSSTATTLKPTADAAASPDDACKNTTTVSGAVSCAATADPKIAGIINSEDFQKAFQKSSGMSLGDFLKNGGNLSANDAIQAAAGAVSGDGSAQLGKAIAAIQKDMPNFNAEASATYAAGGGRKGGSGDPDFANMMNGLMDKLMPKTEEEKKNGIHEVKFSGPVRNLASVTAEDPTVSLFERVAYRYSHVTPRLLSDPSKRTLSDWAPSASAKSPSQK